MNTARSHLASGQVGTSTLTISFGGQEPAASAKTEEWDGSSWTESGDLSTARYNHGGSGTQAAAFSTGGTPATVATEEWTGPATEASNFTSS